MGHDVFYRKSGEELVGEMKAQKQKQAEGFLRKVIKEMGNYYKYNSPLSDDVKQFTLCYKNNHFYFCVDEAKKMLRYYNGGHF